MRGPPPQSSTLFHRLQLRPTASCSNPHFPFGHKSPWDEGQVQLMPPPCQESAGNAKQLVKRLTRNFSLRKEERKEEGDETICISKQLRRAFLPAGPSMLCTHLGSNLLQRHPVGTFELRENLCHWSYLNPLSMLQCCKGIWHT